MTRALLPTCQPFITSFPMIAFNFAILGTEKSYDVWILENLLLLNAFHNSNGAFMRYSDADFKGTGLFASSETSVDDIKSNSSDITSFLIKSINNEQYTRICFDHYYLQCSDYYSVKHFVHPALVYGYDTENMTLNLADFFHHQKFSFETVSFSEVREGFNNADHEHNFGGVLNGREDGLKVVFRCKKNDFQQGIPNPDYKLIADKLVEYLEPKRLQSDIYQGIEVYKMLLGYISGLNDLIDTRLLHMLFDHKKLMNQRLWEISRRIDTPTIRTAYKKYAQEVLTPAELSRNIAVKFNIRKSDKSLTALANYFDNMQHAEIEILPSVIPDLVNYGNIQ